MRILAEKRKQVSGQIVRQLTKKLTASRIYMGRVGPPGKRVSYTLETYHAQFWLTIGNQQSDFWNISGRGA